MAKDRPDADIDRALQDLPRELRWREWMRRIEAVLFASASPVPREDLVRVVGQGASVDLLIEDLIADVAERPYEVAADLLAEDVLEPVARDRLVIGDGGQDRDVEFTQVE